MMTETQRMTETQKILISQVLNKMLELDTDILTEWAWHGCEGPGQALVRDAADLFLEKETVILLANSEILILCDELGHLTDRLGWICRKLKIAEKIGC